jgi:hypothetical protein
LARTGNPQRSRAHETRVVNFMVALMIWLRLHAGTTILTGEGAL